MATPSLAKLRKKFERISQMPKVVVSDTSCLIILTKVDKLDLLQKIYSEVVTTPEVKSEYGNDFPEWIKVIAVSNTSFQKELEQKIDLGESSAIALSLEIPDCVLILDDLKARKMAKSMAINFTGTLGVLVKAKSLSLISAVKPILEEMQKSGLRFSTEITNEILNQAGE